MAHITFLAKNRGESAYQLTRDVVIGRALTCDIFIPDIFVSREHCRIEQTNQGWRITDSRSKNGIFFNGKRFFRRLLKNGEVIELGSVAFEYSDQDILEEESNRAPFGPAKPLTELMDTLFAEGLRAADYVLLKTRDPKEQQVVRWAPARIPVFEEEEPEYFGEWTEVDMEIQMSSLPFPTPLRLCRVDEDGEPIVPTGAPRAAVAEAREEMEDLLPAGSRQAPSPARGARWSGAPTPPPTDRPTLAAARDDSAAIPQAGFRKFGSDKLFDEADFQAPKDSQSTGRGRPVRKPPGSKFAPGHAGPKIKIGPSFTDRLSEWYDSIRAMDISEFIEQARARPAFSASLATAVLALCITWYWWSNRVVYRMPRNGNHLNQAAAQSD